jgi:hypothetical protein
LNLSEAFENAAKDKPKLSVSDQLKNISLEQTFGVIPKLVPDEKPDPVANEIFFERPPPVPAASKTLEERQAQRKRIQLKMRDFQQRLNRAPIPEDIRAQTASPRLSPYFTNVEYWTMQAEDRRTREAIEDRAAAPESEDFIRRKKEDWARQDEQLARADEALKKAREALGIRSSNVSDDLLLSQAQKNKSVQFGNVSTSYLTPRSKKKDFGYDVVGAGNTPGFWLENQVKQEVSDFDAQPTSASSSRPQDIVELSTLVDRRQPIGNTASNENPYSLRSFDGIESSTGLGNPEEENFWASEFDNPNVLEQYSLTGQNLTE